MPASSSFGEYTVGTCWSSSGQGWGSRSFHNGRERAWSMSVAAPPADKVSNYINGLWVDSQATEWRDVRNPATGELLASVPLAGAADANAAVEAASAAFPEWRRTPPEDRIQPLFRLKMLL